jgi:hypothetical protein
MPATIEPYDKVLIVCEGGTEVNYFKGLIGDLKLSTVNIEILDIKQNTPLSNFVKISKGFIGFFIMKQ